MNDKKRKAPPGLADIVFDLLKWHKGYAQAFERNLLLSNCKKRMNCDDTDLRLAIQELREQGVMICGSKKGDGYFIANTLQEYETWRNNYTAPAFTVLKAVKATDLTARKEFDFNPLQEKLF